MPVYGLRPDDVVTDTAGNVQTGATLTLHATQADAEAGVSALASVVTSAGRWSADVAQVPVWVRTPNGAVYEIADFSAKADKTYVDSQIGGLGSTYVRSLGSAPMPAARGAVVFTWDDGYPHWKNYTAPLAKQLGQRHTFCVTTNRIGQSPWQMSSADIAGWFADGHEIAAHTVTHGNMVNQSSATRIGELENSKAALEAIVGAGNVTTFVYPYGSQGSARNTTTDVEVYGRYDRCLDTGPLGRYLMHQRDTFLVSRYAWTAATHKDVLAMIRYAQKHPVIIVVFGHGVSDDPIDPGQNIAGSISLAQAQEAMHLAHDLGVPAITSAEAFPASNLLVNPSFEDGTAGWTIQSTGNDVVDAVTATPDTGVGGTKVGRLKKVDTNVTAIALKQWVPVEPGASYTFKGRVKVVTGPTANVPDGGYWTGKIQLYYGSTVDLMTVTSAGVSPTASPAIAQYGTWVTMETTGPWTCPPGVTAAQVFCTVGIGNTNQTPLPELYFDNLCFQKVSAGNQG